jgi:hypothetical protein
LFSGTAPRHACEGGAFSFQTPQAFLQNVFSTVTDKVIPLGFEVEVGSGHMTYLVSGTFAPGLKSGDRRLKVRPEGCFDNVSVRVKFPDGRIENIPRRAVASVVAEHASEIKSLARESYEKTRGR